MENARKLVYLVKSNDRPFAAKAVFSSAELATQFIEVQKVPDALVEELKDLTLDGLVPLQPVRLYLRDEADQGYNIDSVIEEARAPEFSTTVWFDPLVDENAKGIGLYHSWIRNGRIAEPSLSFGRDGCTCQITDKEAPMLRKDNDLEGMFHCFAKNQQEASLLAHQMMKKYWDALPVDDIAGWNGPQLRENEQIAN